MLTRKRIMAAKLETTVGTPIDLAAADAAFYAYDVQIQPSAEYVERPSQGSASMLPGVVGPRSGTATFRMELYGSGTAEAGGGESVPLWASTLLPCCNIVTTAIALNVWKPMTAGPGVADYAPRTCTIGGYVDGELKMIAGAMGNVVFNFSAGRIVSMDFTFTGIWVAPTAVELLAPTYPTVIPPRFTAAGLATTEYTTCLISELSLDLGNVVSMREDANAANVTGFISAVITDRRITGSFDPEAIVASDVLTFAAWLAGTTQQINWLVGVIDAGNSCAFDCPEAQFQNVQEAERNGLVTHNLEFIATKVADAGDDELTLTFD